MRLRCYKTVAILCLSLLSLSLKAQQTMGLIPEIRTVRLLLNGEAGHLPVITLGGNDVLEVSFDNLTHEYERFEYRLIHCNRDWEVSDGILMSDAVDYTQESIPVEDFDYSMNTTQLYTHYRFEVPSNDARPRISGNYRIEIARDGDYEDGLVAVACFMVVEPLAHISMNVTDDTELAYRKNYQQVQMAVDYGMVSPSPYNAREEISTVVLQNQRWDNARRMIPAEYLDGTTMRWEHSRGLVFHAGNEYRRFENTTTHHAAMGMESLQWHDPYYHARLRLAEPRRNYIFERDQNGICVIRTTENPDVDYAADYMLVHFELAVDEPMPEGQHLYVQGQWTSDYLTRENEMHYRPEMGIYECTMLLKQGYYNYLILSTDSPESPGRTSTIEGDYYQTENQYNALVYYRSAFNRYDRLIGYK